MDFGYLRLSTGGQSTERQLDGAVAEFERTLIGERAAEGRVVAKAGGVQCGRTATLTAAQVRQARAERGAGKTVAAIALNVDVSRPVAYRALFLAEAGAVH